MPQAVDANTAKYGTPNRFNSRNDFGACPSRASPCKVREAKKVHAFPELNADVRIFDPELADGTIKTREAHTTAFINDGSALKIPSVSKSHAQNI